MKIFFAVAVCIISCGIEASPTKSDEFCASPQVEEGTDLPINYSVQNSDVDVRIISYYGEGKLTYEAVENEPNWGVCMSKPKYYTYFVVEPIRLNPYLEDEFPYIKDKVKLVLKEIKFEACKTAYKKGTGIIVRAVFEKDQCDIIINLEISPYKDSQGRNSKPSCPSRAFTDLKDYINTTDFERGDVHKIKWIGAVFRFNGADVSAYLKDGLWTEEYSNTFPLSAEEADIKKFLTQTGLIESSDKRKCKKA